MSAPTTTYEPPTAQSPHTHGADNLSFAMRNSFFGLISLLGKIIGNSVVFFVIARLPSVGVADFGQLTYAFALGSLFSMLSQYGLSSLMIRNVAANPASLRNQVGSAFSLRVIFSCLGIVSLIGYLGWTRISHQGFLVGCIMAVALYASSLSVFFQCVFRCRERMHLESLAILVENGLLIVLAALAACFDADIVQVALIFLGTKCLALPLNYLLCGRYVIWVRPIFSVSIWKEMLVEATPFALAGVITMGIVQIDTVVMRELLSPATAENAVGVYQAAVRLFLVPMVLPQLALKVFLPQFSRMHGQLGPRLTRDLGRLNRVLLTMGVLVGTVTVLRGNDLIELVYGEKLSAAGPVLQVLGITVMMRFGVAYTLYFTIRNRIWFRVFAGLATLVTVIVLDCLLIPRYGPLGAAYTSVLAHLFYRAIYLIAFYMEERTIGLDGRIGYGLAVTGAVGFFVWLTSGLNVAIMLPMYSVVILAATFGGMVREDRRMLLARFGLKGMCPA